MKASTVARDQLASSWAGVLNAGTVKFYSGGPPADPQTAPSGTLAATFTFPNPAFGSAVNGTVTQNAGIQVSVVTTVTVGWARIAKADGTAMNDVTVGTSAADLVTANVDWEVDDVVNVLLTYTQPE
jgi:hypothetical protein